MSLFSWRRAMLLVSALAWMFALYWAYSSWQTSQPYNNAIYACLAGLATLIGVVANRPKESPSASTTSASGHGTIQSSRSVSATGSSISAGNINCSGDVNITNICRQEKPSAPAYRPKEAPASNELPERADLPPGSLVPFYPNEVFTGRREDLLNLAEDLLRSAVRAVGLTQSAAVATGYGGIGKTQLAVEFCYRYGCNFQGVHWISADLDIPAEISACGEVMGLSPWPDELPERVRATLNAWNDGQPRLVVLDNVTDQEAVSKWMPQMPRCRLLITSRQQDWPSDMGLKIRPVNVFSPDRSRELLIKLASRLNEESLADLDMIADRLGNLPLALDLAGRYLADRPGLKPKDYLKALDEEGNALDHSSLKDWVKHNPTAHATNLAATFALSWDRLSDDGEDSLARRIFRICGYCAANTPIPVELLAKAAGTGESTEDMDRALKRLSQLGMAILIGGRPALHPLLAEFARMQDETDCVLPGLADALIDLAGKANETGYPKQMEPLREHLEIVAGTADRRNLQSASRLLSLLASHKRKTAEYDRARKLYKRSLEIDEKANGPDHPSVATIVNNLGLVLRDLGDLQEARKFFKRALKINEKVYGPAHPRVATDVNNLGCVLQDLGDLQEARKCFERALKINEKVYGLDHPLAAKNVNNLGGVLHDLGDLQEARKCYGRALKIDEKVYGKDHHPSVARDVNNLGGVLQVLGDLQEARKCYERAIEIDEKVYGPDHPEVATDVNNLGGVLRDLGDLQEARKCYGRALKIDEKVYGPYHPSVARDVNNLGSVLQALGDLQEARKCYERALKIDEKVYGPDHPNVARDVNNLGGVLQDLGELQEARKCYERAFEIFRESLGPDHPKTKIAADNLKALGKG